ncbi:MAG: hypothetical protein Q4G63_05345 [Bacteroidia bacterium]|nr:hypothetical protein [Bacteroidia bacterium]
MDAKNNLSEREIILQENGYICTLIMSNMMGHEAIKLELIEWLTQLENDDTIRYLKTVKDSDTGDNDWWKTLTEEQKTGIEKGLKDIDEGRTVTHQIVKEKYGL